jgi:hypothetical protein
MGKTCEKANDIILEKAIVLNFNQTQNTINIKLTTLLSNFSWALWMARKKTLLENEISNICIAKTKALQNIIHTKSQPKNV